MPPNSNSQSAFASSPLLPLPVSTQPLPFVPPTAISSSSPPPLTLSSLPIAPSIVVSPISTPESSSSPSFSIPSTAPEPFQQSAVQETSLAELFSTPASSLPVTPTARSSTPIANTPKRKSISSPADSVTLSPPTLAPKARKVAVESPSSQPEPASAEPSSSLEPTPLSPEPEPVSAEPPSSREPTPSSSAQPVHKGRNRAKAADRKKLKQQAAERNAYHSSQEWKDVNDKLLQASRDNAHARYSSEGKAYLETLSSVELLEWFPDIAEDLRASNSGEDDNDDLITATGATDQFDDDNDDHDDAYDDLY